MWFNSFVAAAPGAVAQGIIWGVAALGIYITFRLLNFADLTVDGTLCTGGAVAVVLITAGWSPYLAILVSFAAGCLAGALTGFFHTVLGIPDILSGILSQFSLYSINLAILGGANLGLNLNSVTVMVSSRSDSIGRTILIALLVTAILIAASYWFFGTEVGSAIRATGSNPHMARAQGINTNRTKMLALIISNGLVGLAGGLLAQFQGAADVNMGRGAIVYGLAAVVIGEVVFGSRFNFVYKLSAVVAGSVIYWLLYQAVLGILTVLRWNTNYMKMLAALVVAICLAVPYLKGKMAHKKKTGKKGVA